MSVQIAAHSFLLSNPKPRRDCHCIFSAQTQKPRWTGLHIPYGKPGPCASSLTDLIGFCHHAKVELAICSLLNVRQDIDVGFNAESTQVTLVTSTTLFGRLSDCIQHSPFGIARNQVSQACPQRPTSVQSRSRNPVPPLFSPPQARLLAHTLFQKTVVPRSSTALRPRGSGPF